MANMRDISLWLHNKLGTSDDSWTGGSICSQLNAQVLGNIKDCFPDLQTQVKLKLLLSFFHVPRRNIEKWRNELVQIIEVAIGDFDLWVAMIAEALKTFPATGSLNTEILDLDEVRPIFTNLVNDLRILVRKQADKVMLPMECHYLNKAALTSVVGQQPAMTKHFTIKKKPKSVLLRNELLQKSLDAASNLKKSSAPVIPLRSREMPRKMSDTTPLKGIPSRYQGSSFCSAILNNAANNRPPISRPPAGRKDGGVKLLDIADQPLGYAAAKKRKRMQEIEDAKKTTEANAVITSPTSTNPIPDYAAGLAIPSYVPPTPQAVSVPASTPVITHAPLAATASASKSPVQQPVAPPLEQQVIALTPVPGLLATAPTPAAVTTIPVNKPIVIANRQSIQQVTPNANSLQRRGLDLTREQMLEAQDMLRTANKITRPEKALILSFMAGSRNNPCPHLGNIVTLKLSEEQVGQQPAMTKHFTIKKKPKSVLLRNELLQKSLDAASNLKKSSAPVIPLRSREMPRKMSDTTPLKGIPSRYQGSSFCSAILNNAANNRPPISRPPAGRKDGGVKLLDIADQPLGYAAAKKRKRMQEIEDAKKTTEANAVITSPTSTNPIPDYAAGLAIPSYVPPTPQAVSVPASTPVITHAPLAATASASKSPVQQPVAPPLEQQVIALTPVPGLLATAPTPAAVTTIPVNKPIVIANRQSIQQVTPNANSLQRRGLDLTREQMLEAQDMLRTANKITRPEKALILSFMAGSRNNPCPHLGNIVTLKLSEEQVNVLQADGTYLTMIAEIHFQMNYNNGEWKRLKKFRQ